jgi:hypothetical protein
MSTIYDIQHNEYRAAIRGSGRAHGECYQIPTLVRCCQHISAYHISVTHISAIVCHQECVKICFLVDRNKLYFTVSRKQPI